MNLKGRRQSDNIDNITKQKPKVRTDKFAFPASEGGFIGDIKLKSTMSRKKSNSGRVNSESLRQKTGMNSMEDANRRDSENIKNLQDEKKYMDELLDKAFSPEKKTGGSAGYDKLAEATAPKQLSEIWTPRPLKKK